MNIQELINKNGLDSLVQSIFKKLKGIEFDQVVYNHELNSKNPLEYMTSDIDGDWRFAVGSMTMLVKPCSEKKIDDILNQLLLSNDIDINSGYKEGYDDITFWNGNEFKIITLN